MVFWSCVKIGKMQRKMLKWQTNFVLCRRMNVTLFARLPIFCHREIESEHESDFQHRNGKWRSKCVRFTEQWTYFLHSSNVILPNLFIFTISFDVSGIICGFDSQTKLNLKTKSKFKNEFVRRHSRQKHKKLNHLTKGLLQQRNTFCG